MPCPLKESASVLPQGSIQNVIAEEAAACVLAGSIQLHEYHQRHMRHYLVPFNWFCSASLVF
jgi:hypothetical protein